MRSYSAQSRRMKQSMSMMTSSAGAGVLLCMLMTFLSPMVPSRPRSSVHNTTTTVVAAVAVAAAVGRIGFKIRNGRRGFISNIKETVIGSHRKNRADVINFKHFTQPSSTLSPPLRFVFPLQLYEHWRQQSGMYFLLFSFFFCRKVQPKANGSAPWWSRYLEKSVFSSIQICLASKDSKRLDGASPVGQATRQSLMKSSNVRRILWERLYVGKQE